MNVTTQSAPLILTSWRDHDSRVLHLPKTGMGTTPAQGDPVDLAAGLFRDGARRVALDRPIDLSGEAADEQALVRAMVLLRELTSWGVVIDWRLRADADDWHRLSHLFPPAELLGGEPGAEEFLRTWREDFYICKCVHRRGPGFVEVRDRRRGGWLSRFIVDDPASIEAIDALSAGAPADSIPPAILEEFKDADLVHLCGPQAWWLPHRPRRWPWPSMAI